MTAKLTGSNITKSLLQCRYYNTHGRTITMSARRGAMPLTKGPKPSVKSGAAEKLKDGIGRYECTLSLQLPSNFSNTAKNKINRLVIILPVLSRRIILDGLLGVKVSSDRKAETTDL